MADQLLAQGLFSISPYSPTARAIMVDLHWEMVSEYAADWEQEAQQPVVVLSSATRSKTSPGWSRPRSASSWPGWGPSDSRRSKKP